ncbi:MAG TPA: DNA polymerase III subunit gamma/tau [Methylomirabilota bacterium]|nr:DNA polymerase III subunit gamma/tau [Burkholderiales bacterium]HXU87655.1 DNA polymerase III subunit gamma/tau [Methylomirabilota bacterium]
MSYQVLARKWRPQVFEAVVGQDAITRTLRNALASGRVAHAYLFAGPRGVGKTTTARLLARALLCPERTGPEACGKCAVCRDAGTSVDVIEIDGASNRGIEEIRTLRENVKYAPSRGRYKVYIIDEVHQLTEAAFNALLKTLEEPPAHVVFILATTDPRDIPATVLSRVQRFEFRPIAPEALATTLERILTEEKIPFDAAALPAVVRAAEGSLRDALSLLDTAIAYGNGRLEAETTAQLLGTTAPAEVRAFAAALLAHETAPALEAVDRASRDGEDLHAFTRDVIELLRRALVLKAAPTTKLADVTHTEGNELRKLGETVSVDELLYILRAFLDADADMRESPHPRVELEMATVRATRRPAPKALEEILQRVDEAARRLRSAGPTAAPLRGQDSLPAAESGPRPTPAPRGPTSTERPAPVEQKPTTVDPAATAEIGSTWQRVVDEVMRRKPTLGAVLAQSKPGALRDGELTIVLSGNHFHREMLSDGASRELVLQALRRHLPGVERFRISAEDEGGGGVSTHPAVQAAMAQFQGEVVAVRPRSPEGEGQ